MPAQRPQRPQHTHLKRSTSDFDRSAEPPANPKCEATALLKLLGPRFTLEQICELVSISADERSVLSSSLDEVTASAACDYRARVLAEIQKRTGGNMAEKPIDILERLAKSIASQQSISNDEQRKAARNYLESKSFLLQELERRHGVPS